MSELADRQKLNLATRLAKEHRAANIIFWTAEDWGAMHGVSCRRLDNENVQIAVRTVGRGFLDPETTKN